MSEQKEEKVRVMHLGFEMPGGTIVISWKMEDIESMIRDILADAVEEEPFDTAIQRVADFMKKPHKVQAIPKEPEKKPGGSKLILPGNKKIIPPDPGRLN